MARVLSSNIVMRSTTAQPSGQDAAKPTPRLPAESPITRAFQALWGPDVEVLDLPAPHSTQRD